MPDGAGVLGDALSLVEPGLRAAVSRLPEPVRTVAAYHFGWRDAEGRADDRGGKAVRPALVLECARAAGGRAEDAVAGAVAVELAHNFTLLHDDVMDRDRVRRGRPAAWCVFGEADAILAGDALLVTAVETLATDPSPHSGRAVRLLCRAFVDMVRGQGNDLAFEQRRDVPLEEGLAMAAGKTAALLESACKLGALLAGADAQRIRSLGLFGHHLGMAFQLVDDQLGIWGDPALTGEPVRADLRAAKKSLPVIAALTSGTPAAEELAALYLGEPRLEEPQLDRVTQLIEQAGGQTWAHKETNRQLHLALDHLAAADPDRRSADRLTALAQLVVHRSY